MSILVVRSAVVLGAGLQSRTTSNSVYAKATVSCVILVCSGVKPINSPLHMCASIYGHKMCQRHCLHAALKEVGKNVGTPIAPVTVG